MTLPSVTLSLTELQCFKALRTYVLGVLPAGTEVIRAEFNRVPEPVGDNFVVLTALHQEPLATNYTVFEDNVLTGSIAGTTLTVTAIPQAESPLAAGMLLIDKPGDIAPLTEIVTQLSGTPGGTGTYTVSASQALDSTTLYAGRRSDLTPVEWTVQIDVHGPLSGDNSRRIAGLFRSEYATDAFRAVGFDVTPLYCETPRQRPFVNAEQQYEFRWSFDARMQINPVIGTPQRFAEQLDATVVDVPETFPP
jgi:hypothetical protein